jgi:hypothetical protein
MVMTARRLPSMTRVPIRFETFVAMSKWREHYSNKNKINAIDVASWNTLD